MLKREEIIKYYHEFLNTNLAISFVMALNIGDELRVVYPIMYIVGFILGAYNLFMALQNTKKERVKDLLIISILAIIPYYCLIYLLKVYLGSYMMMAIALFLRIIVSGPSKKLLSKWKKTEDPI